MSQFLALHDDHGTAALHPLLGGKPTGRRHSSLARAASASLAQRSARSHCQNHSGVICV
jgi:hypothetical protein